MSEDADRYARVSSGFTERLDGVARDQWTLATAALLDAVRDPARADTEVQAFAGPTLFRCNVSG
jgi:hypothetical protein